MGIHTEMEQIREIVNDVWPETAELRSNWLWFYFPINVHNINHNVDNKLPISSPGNIRRNIEGTTGSDWWWTSGTRELLRWLETVPIGCGLLVFVVCCASVSDFCYTALGLVQHSRLGWTLQFVMEDSWWILDSLRFILVNHRSCLVLFSTGTLQGTNVPRLPRVSSKLRNAPWRSWG